MAQFQLYSAEEVKEMVDKAVAEAIENAAQVLYVAAELTDSEQDELTYCGAAERVRRSIDPEFN